MAASKSERSPNQVLASLPSRVYHSLTPLLEPVELMYGQVLYEPGAIMTHVYFPLDGLVSLLTAVDSGHSTEVGMVGREGMLGIPMALGVRISPVRALVQGSGGALRMSAPRFRARVKAEPPLLAALLRYTHGLMCQFAQTAACNRFHTTDARMARWLLMTADRMGSDQFYLTQNFLAQMLGMRRVGVTKAARELEAKGLISYTRGRLAIRDHAGLDGAACACYGIVNELQNFPLA